MLKNTYNKCSNKSIRKKVFKEIPKKKNFFPHIYQKYNQKWNTINLLQKLSRH